MVPSQQPVAQFEGPHEGGAPTQVPPVLQVGVPPLHTLHVPPPTPHALGAEPP